MLPLSFKAFINLWQIDNPQKIFQLSPFKQEQSAKSNASYNTEINASYNIPYSALTAT